MAYEITCDAGGLMQQSTSEDVEGSYETARSAKRGLVLPWEALSTCAVFSFGDGVKLTDDQLHKNIQLEEIQEFIQGQTSFHPPTGTASDTNRTMARLAPPEPRSRCGDRANPEDVYR